MAQTWNDVLEYIKIHLGVPVNILEISDEDIIRLLKNQVLPIFSQFSPRKKFGKIDNTNRHVGSFKAQPQWEYKIPLDADEYIIDIRDVYAGREPAILDTFGGSVLSSLDVIDVVMANSFTDAIRSMTTRQSWEFLPPNILLFDKPFRIGIIEYYTVHTSLTTIEPDKYHLYFKKLCLANIKLWVSSMRSKFDQLNTPAAQLQLNWERLETQGNQEKDEVMQALNLLPTDFLIYIV